MIEKNIKRNKSSHFILPIFGYHIIKNSPLDYYLINTYVSKNYKFYIVFDNSDNDKLAMLIYHLQNHPNYKDCNFGDDDREVILEFGIPHKYKWDFDMFVKGQYSKFSIEFKDLLSSCYGTKSTRKQKDTNGKPVVTLFDAIYPTTEKIEDIAEYYNVDVSIIKECGEILDPPDIEKESLKTVTELYGIEQQST